MTETTNFNTADEMQKALDRKREAYYGVKYAPLLETCEVDQDGVIVDRDPVNELLQLEEKVSVWNNFAPTDSQIAALILAVLLALGFGIDQAMKGDLAAMRFEGNGASGR